MRLVRFATLTIAMLALVVLTASAQPIISARSGVIAGLEGKVFLDNQALESSVTHFPDMKENSVLRTEDPLLWDGRQPVAQSQCIKCETRGIWRARRAFLTRALRQVDRKSTRLNSSHLGIS